MPAVSCFVSDCIYNSGKFPHECKSSDFLKIEKLGEIAKCRNYRQKEAI